MEWSGNGCRKISVSGGGESAKSEGAIYKPPRRFVMKGVMGGALRLQNIVGKIKRMVSGKK